jgi:hypothetical protein
VQWSYLSSFQTSRGKGLVERLQYLFHSNFSLPIQILLSRFNHFSDSFIRTSISCINFCIWFNTRRYSWRWNKINDLNLIVKLLLCLVILFIAATFFCHAFVFLVVNETYSLMGTLQIWDAHFFAIVFLEFNSHWRNSDLAFCGWITFLVILSPSNDLA